MADFDVTFNLDEQTPITADFSLGESQEVTADFYIGVSNADHNLLINRDLPNQHPISAITGLESALETLQSNIETEATAREEADTALDTKIDNIEISVEADIQAEATAREQADTRLEGLIEAEETRAKGVEEQLSDDITAENTRAVNAEEALQDNIDDEETRATTAEGNLQTAITNEASTRASEITRVEGLISAETTRATNAENGLRTDLTAETSARQSADSTLQTNINNEKTARENADTTLQGNINAEALARQNADLTLQGNIDTEATTRGNADTALNTKIDNHIADKANPHQVTKAQVGLGNVDNTADIDKPISTAVSSAFDAVEDEITDINSKIPSQASSSNQLADKAFVNSTVQTSTANFRGNWETWSDVPTNAEDYPLDYAQNRTPTVNDYMVVRDASDYGLETLDGRWRFKYTGLWSVNGKSGWHPEYQVNETPFTIEQWNAINSGATDTLIDQITTNEGNITTIQTTMSGYGNIVTHNVSEFATSAQGTKADTAVQPTDLATVATSGSYNDLGGKPTIGSGVLTIQKNGTDIDTFSANATANKTINMTVPTDTNELTNGAGYITGVDWGEIGGTLSNQTDLQNAFNSKQDVISDLATIRSGAALGATAVQSVTTGTTNGTIKVDGNSVSVYGLGSAAYTASTAYDASGSASTAETNAKNYADSLSSNYATAAQGALADTAVQPADLATVATTGDYDDLLNKPSIPAAQVNSDWNATSGVAQILNKPSLATVATSGAYADLSGTPTIPTVNDATLTIQKNGASVATFTANSATNATANISVPIDTADLTNGAGFITGITSSDVTSALGYTPYNSTNPSGYQTAADVASAISGKQDTLVSGTNIKSINGSSVLGSGDLTISATASFASLTGDPGDNEDLVEWFDAKANTDLSNLDATGKSYGAGLSMPSDTYTDLALQASGSSYTAPANGYYYLRMVSTANTDCGFQMTSGILGITDEVFQSGAHTGGIIPVKTGDNVSIYYWGSYVEAFRFVYAQGEI